MRKPRNFRMEEVKSEEQRLDRIEAQHVDEIIRGKLHRSTLNAQRRYPIGKSGYRGVKEVCNWKPGNKAWRAYMKVRSVDRSLGSYDTKEEAARAYDRAALDIYGPRAILNFPDEADERMKEMSK